MALILVFAHYSRWLSFARALLAETRETRVCAAMPIRVARAAARRYSSHAPLAPRFATTLNYTTSDMIQLAQSDEAAAVRGFWQPLRDYRSLMRSLSERHAREELGLDGEAALAAAIRVESADQRRTRLASFGSFMAALTSSGDEEAAAAAAAGREAGGAFRQSVEVEVGDARRDLSPADATLGAAGFSIERHGAGGGGGGGGGGEAGADAAERYRRAVQELVRERTGASHVFCSPAKVTYICLYLAISPCISRHRNVLCSPR